MRKRERDGGIITDDNAPSFTMPLIRRLCASFSCPAAIPHIYAGVCSILTYTSQSPKSSKGVAALAQRNRLIGLRNSESSRGRLNNPILDPSNLRSKASPDALNEDSITGQKVSRRTHPVGTTSRSELQSGTSNDVDIDQSHFDDGGITTAPIEESQIPSLILTLLLLVYPRIRGKETAEDEVQAQFQQGLEVLWKAVEEGAIPENICENSNENTNNDDIDELSMEDATQKRQRIMARMRSEVFRFLRASQYGWKELEWYVNITEGSGLSIQRHSTNGSQNNDDMDFEYDDNDVLQGEENDDVPSPTADRSKRLQLSSTDVEDPFAFSASSMMQGQVNYWSDAYKRDYAAWKKKIMKRIDEIERKKASRPSEETLVENA
jgi:hypothetical protein